MISKCTSVYTKVLQCTLLLINMVLFTTPAPFSYAKCSVTNVGCSNRNLANYGHNSNTIAAIIAYDNFVSSLNNTVARTGDGSLQFWFKDMDNNGIVNAVANEVITVTPLTGDSDPDETTLTTVINWRYTINTRNGAGNYSNQRNSKHNSSWSNYIHTKC